MTANVPERLEWSGKNGAEERFFCMTAEPGASFEEELQSLMARYRNLGGGEEDEFLLRFHVSDPVRQSAPLRQITGEREFLCFHSWTAPCERGPRGSGSLAHRRNAGKKA